MNEVDIVITRISSIDLKHENDIRKVFNSHIGIASPDKRIDLDSIVKDYSNIVIASIANRANEFVSEFEKLLADSRFILDQRGFKLIEAEILNKIDDKRYTKRLDSFVGGLARSYSRYGVDIYDMGCRLDLSQAGYFVSVKNTVRRKQRYVKAELSLLRKKTIRKRRVLEKYWELNTMQKIGLWGSLASIFGLVIALFSFDASSGNTVIDNSGSRNPVITNSSGDVHINYNENQNENKRRYVLRNNQGGQPPLLTSPKLSFIMDSSNYVCTPIIGEEIQPLDAKASEGGHVIWRKIIVMEGDCKGKEGWVLTNDISIE